MEPGFLIPILVPLGFFALIFGLVYMHKKEGLAMLDKGMNPRNRYERGPEPFRSLKWGLLLVGSGLGLLVAYFIDNAMGHKDQNIPVYFALIAVGGGIGLIISYIIEMKDLKNRKSISNQAPSEL